MTVTELRNALDSYPDDMEVLTRQWGGYTNVAHVNSVREDTYCLFGMEIPCVLLTDEYEPKLAGIV